MISEELEVKRDKCQNDKKQGSDKCQEAKGNTPFHSQELSDSSTPNRQQSIRASSNKVVPSTKKLLYSCRLLVRGNEYRTHTQIKTNSIGEKVKKQTPIGQ